MSQRLREVRVPPFRSGTKGVAPERNAGTALPGRDTSRAIAHATSSVRGRATQHLDEAVHSLADVDMMFDAGCTGRLPR